MFDIITLKCTVCQYVYIFYAQQCVSYANNKTVLHMLYKNKAQSSCMPSALLFIYIMELSIGSLQPYTMTHVLHKNKVVHVYFNIVWHSKHSCLEKTLAQYRIDQLWHMVRDFCDITRTQCSSNLLQFSHSSLQHACKQSRAKPQIGWGN